MDFQEKLVKLRKEKGMTQEELAFEVGVSRQSVSKWETGEAEPNVTTLKELSKVFGVSLDYLLGDEEVSAPNPPMRRRVSMEEAKGLLSVSKRSALWLALATLLCILSPVCIILLSGLSEYASIPLTEGMAAGVGMIILLVFVAVAVAIFIVQNAKLSPYAYFEKESFETEAGVRTLAEQAKANYKNAYIRNNILGACLCILSLIPLFIGVIIDENNDLLLTVMTACIFPIAGAGVAFLVFGGVIWGSFEKLLQCGDFTKKKKAGQEARHTFSWVYWLTVTALFLALAIPFGRNWKYVGLIWVVAGVLYPALLALFDCLYKKKK